MNHPFIKMLRFELKSNYMMWVYCTTIGILTIAFFYLFETKKQLVPQIFISFYMLLTWLFTINSYQESTKNQTMQMYHLIPVSGNMKFFSKQLITIVLYPIGLWIVTCFIIELAKFVWIHEEVKKQSHFLFWAVWPLGQSLSTLLSIILKKNKIYYAILIFFGIHLVMSPFLIPLALADWHTPQARIDFYNSLIPYLCISAILVYGISYRLFFRRQL